MDFSMLKEIKELDFQSYISLILTLLIDDWDEVMRSPFNPTLV